MNQILPDAGPFSKAGNGLPARLLQLKIADKPQNLTQSLLLHRNSSRSEHLK